MNAPNDERSRGGPTALDVVQSAVRVSAGVMG
jgi:hypothetical protein